MGGAALAQVNAQVGNSAKIVLKNRENIKAHFNWVYLKVRPPLP